MSKGLQANTWRTLRRLSLALMLSLSVLGSSLYFAKRIRTVSNDTSDQKPIAFARQIEDEVERRAVTSLVWQGLNQGEPLFPGEAIKTSAKGEIRIQFAESDRFINLDPDSLIVISQGNHNEISLDLKGGSLLVGQTEGATKSTGDEPALTLNSDQGKVDLSKATAQLSKSAGQKLDVQVLKGKAKLESGGKSQEIDASKPLSSLEILSPALDRPYYINTSAPRPVVFKWVGFPPKSEISLLVGKLRKDLAAPEKLSPSTSDSLSWSLPVGKHFWKLVAKDPTTKKVVQESSVYRLEVAGRSPPTLVSPEANSLIPLEKQNSPVEFKWLSPEAAKSTQIEISKDEDFSSKVATQNFTGKESFQKQLGTGTFYWRMSAQYEGMEQPATTKPIKFSIGIVKPPKPPVAISWSNPNTESQYFITDPLATLAWSTEQKDQVKMWRLKLAPNEEALTSLTLDDIVTEETAKPAVKKALPKPGRYIAMVEALDEKNKVLAKSAFKTIEVAPLPLIPSPVILPETGELKASNQGQLDVRWTKIEGAKEYWLSLFDGNGKELRKAKFNGQTTSLVNLFPGQYKVNVYAVDNHGRESLKENPRTVIVPEGSGLMAPKLKKIKVK